MRLIDENIAHGEYRINSGEFLPVKLGLKERKCVLEAVNDCL